MNWAPSAKGAEAWRWAGHVGGACVRRGREELGVEVMKIHCVHVWNCQRINKRLRRETAKIYRPRIESMNYVRTILKFFIQASMVTTISNKERERMIVWKFLLMIKNLKHWETLGKSILVALPSIFLPFLPPFLLSFFPPFSFPPSGENVTLIHVELLVSMLQYSFVENIRLPQSTVSDFVKHLNELHIVS